MSTLYLVGTPIGNLGDISPRALATLKAVTLIAAEDTRTAQKLLTHYAVQTPVTSFYEHSRVTKLEWILERLAAGDVAVISEAGMPGVNDPGFELVRAALERGHTVSPIPGASAVLTALVASGLSAGSFYYLGFMPREPQARRKLLRQVANEPSTLIAFETPHRLNRALEDVEAILGADRRMCIGRELTKLYEEFLRGTAAELRRHFEQNEPRGEFTLVIAGKIQDRRARTASKNTVDDAITWDDARVRREFKRLVKQGVARTEAVKRLARASGRDRRAVYELVLRG